MVRKFNTMSRSAQLQSDLAGDGPISEEGLAYLEQRALGQFYDYVLSKFEEEEAKSALSKAKLARRIRRGPDQINRLLASPGNWTIGTVARLLAGIAGEEPVLSSNPLFGQSPQNMTVMDLLEDNAVKSKPAVLNPMSIPTFTSSPSMTVRVLQAAN